MGETVETMRTTVQYSLELDPDLAIYNISTPYPGTQLFQWAKDNSYLVTEEWSEYELSSFLLRLPTVTADEVHSIYQEAMRKFYMRPVAFWRRLKKMRQWSHLRDAINAFFFIVLRHKLGHRGEVKRDWTENVKTDFMDLKLIQNREIPKLTFQLRQKDVETVGELGIAA